MARTEVDFEHGRFSEAERAINGYRCRFCDRRATIWLETEKQNGDKTKLAAFCDNHAIQAAWALLHNIEPTIQEEKVKLKTEFKGSKIAR